LQALWLAECHVYGLARETAHMKRTTYLTLAGRDADGQSGRVISMDITREDEAQWRAAQVLETCGDGCHTPCWRDRCDRRGLVARHQRIGSGWPNKATL